jgi:hypothetical protein
MDMNEIVQPEFEREGGKWWFGATRFISKSGNCAPATGNSRDTGLSNETHHNTSLESPVTGLGEKTKTAR